MKWSDATRERAEPSDSARVLPHPPRPAGSRVETRTALPEAVRSLRRAATLVGGNLALTALLLVIVEGLSSTVLVVRELLASKPLAERRYTAYDHALGWISVPNIDIGDMYGPGVPLRTNAQRFRGHTPVSVDVPPGRVRIICSGDSFTFGYGVGDDQTWCRQLEALEPALETVNMGQGGYGIDQAYLWYKRDGVPLEHDVHLFTFVTVDFDRMLFDHFLGYGKPVLALQNGTLSVANVPVPQPSWLRLWLNRHARTVAKLRTVSAIQRWLRAPDPMLERSKNIELGARLQQVVSHVFEDLCQTNHRKRSVLVLVYLPTRKDYTGDRSEFWREFLHAEAARKGLHFVDVIEELRQLPPQAVRELFIPAGTMDYAGAAGHYTVAGNAFVASVLRRELAALPEVQARLQRARTGGDSPRF